MTNYKTPKQFTLLILALVFAVSACGTKQEVQPTPQTVADQKVDLKGLSFELARDQDFKAYLLKIVDVYKGQSKLMHEQYQGDAKAYQNDVRAIYNTNERSGWNEARVAQLGQKMGLVRGALLDLVGKRQVVLTKFKTLNRLSEDDTKAVMKESLKLLAENVRSRTNNACEEACAYDYLACLAATTGVSIGLLAGCLAFTHPAAIAACAALIVISDAVVLGSCYFSVLACERRC